MTAKYNIITGDIISEGYMTIVEKITVDGIVSTDDNNIDGNLTFSSGSGSPGHYIRKGPNNTQMWSNIKATDVEPGNDNQVLVTISNDPVEEITQWSDNLNINAVSTATLNITDDFQINYDSGNNGQLLRKTLEGPRWTIFPLSNIPVGESGKVLTTNSNRSVGWADPQSGGIIPGDPNQILITNNGLKWSSSITSTTTTVSGKLNIEGNLLLNNVAGSTNRFVRKSTGSAQGWSKINVGDIVNGPYQSILASKLNEFNEVNNVWVDTINIPTITADNLTDSTGKSINFSEGQRTEGKFVKKTGPNSQEWEHMDTIDVATMNGGSENQILVSGLVWKSTMEVFSLNLNGVADLSHYNFIIHNSGWQSDDSSIISTEIILAKLGPCVVATFPGFLVSGALSLNLTDAIPPSLRPGRKQTCYAIAKKSTNNVPIPVNILSSGIAIIPDMLDVEEIKGFSCHWR